MRSSQMQPLLGTATAGLMAIGPMFQLPFLVTELMGPSVREGPPLTSAQEAVLWRRCSSCMPQESCMGTCMLAILLLPARIVQQQHPGPCWADFRVGSC